MPENDDDTKRRSAADVEEGIFEDDEIPDMSTPYWEERILAAPLQRGRPRQMTTKIQTTLRLDPEVIERFKADGPGWQSRMNAALRRAVGLS